MNSTVVVFDFFADLGHFKMPYTTTSPLTFPIPSKTAIYGIIGAVIGLDKDKYLKHFQNESCKIAIELKNPLKKTYISENFINSKNVIRFARMNSSKRSPRTQIKIEMLSNPAYRIYVSHKDNELLKKLKNNLKNHKSCYSVSMGLSECLANFNYIDCMQAEKSVNLNGEFIKISSVIPMGNITNSDEINFENKKILKTHIPLEMKEDRELLKIEDILVEINCKNVEVKAKYYYRIDNKNILFF